MLYTKELSYWKGSSFFIIKNVNQKNNRKKSNSNIEKYHNRWDDFFLIFSKKHPFNSYQKYIVCDNFKNAIKYILYSRERIDSYWRKWGAFVCQKNGYISDIR